MARNSEFFLGGDYVELIKLGSEHVRIYLGDALVYQHGIDISTATVTCSPRTYTGSTLIANVITVVHDGNTLVENVDYEITTNNGGTNVGTYTVVVTGLGTYRNTASGTFSITKAVPIYTAPTANNATYSGNAINLLVAGSTSHGTIQYSSDNSSWSTTIPTGTNANTYTSYWRLVGDSNHTDVSSTSIGTTIAKANPTYTAPANNNPTYTGSAVYLMTSGSTSHGTIQYSSDNSSWSTSIPTATNAGSYDRYWRLIGDSNHNDVGSTKVTCSIATAAMTGVANPTATSYTYSGSAQNLLNAGTATGGTWYYSSDNSSWSTSIPTGTNAGDYTSYAKLVSDSNHKGDIASFSIGTNIARHSISPSVSLSGWTYGATANNPSVSGNSGSGSVTYYYKVSGAADSTYTTTKPSNAGSYVVKAEITQTTNYLAGSATNTFSIARASGSVTVNGVSLSYNGSSRNLATVSGATGTMHYSTDYSNWSTSIPSSVNAGSWNVYWYMDASTNYEGIGASSSRYVSSSIAKIDPTYSAPTAKSGLVYNGSSQTLYNVGSNTTAGSFSYSDGARTNAGSQTVYWTFTPTDTTNYNTKSGSFTGSIAKADGSVSISGVSLSYNGSSRNLASVSGNTGTMHYATSYGTWSTNIPTSTNAGSWTIYWYMDESTNYNGISASTSRYVSSSIGKINPTYTAPTAKTGLTYNGSSQTLYNAGSNTTAGSFGYSNGTRTNAGSQTVSWSFTPTDTTNYNSASGTLTGSIAKASGSVNISGVSLSYNGSSRNLVSVSGNTGTMHYGTSYGTWSTSIPTSTNSGSWTIYWYMDASDNYEAISASTSRYVSSSISKIDPTYTAPTAKTGLVYSGSSQYLYNSGSNTTAGSFGYSYGTRTDAGSQTVYWSFTPTDTTNYNSASGSFTGSIDKASGSAYATANSWTYNGTAYGLVYNAGGYGTLQYQREGYSWSTSIPTVTDAGSYNCRVYSPGDSNHYEAYSGWYTCTVSKASGSVSISGVSVTYNGNSRSLASVGGATGTMHYSTDYSNWSTTIPSATNAGSWTIYWYMDASANYNSVSASTSRYVSSSIAKADQSAPTAYGASVVYGNTATASTSGGGGVGSIEWSNGSTLSGNVGSKTTKARWTGNGNYNASAWSNEVTLSITQASGSVSISGVSLTYNGNSRSLASVSGNTGTMHYSTDYSNWSTSIPAATDVGSWTIYWYMDASTNYAGISASTSRYVSSSIGKADQSAPTAYGASVTYGNTAYASASGGGGVGSIEWSNGSSLSGNVGSKTTYARWTGNSNYNASGWSNAATLSITQASGSVNISGVSLSYNGSSRSLASVSGNTGTMHYSTDYSNWSTSIPTATNAGSWTIYWYMDASTNYTGIGASTSRYVSSSIAKINPTVTAAPTNANPTYNGSAQYLLTGGTANVSGSFGYSTGTNAGSYTASWTFYPSDSTNYNNVSGSVAATIAKASGSAYATANGWTYNGTAYGVVYSAGGYGSLQYRLEGGSWSTSVPTATNAGTYKCQVYSSGDSNHNEAYSGWYTCTVNKADQSAPTASGATTTYGTTAYASASGGGGVGSIEWSNGGSRSTAGSQNTKARWSGNGNYNASPWSNEVTITVNKANPSYTAPTAKSGLVYNGSAQTLYNAGSNTTSGSFGYTSGTRTAAGSQTVYWSFTPTDTTNYNSASGSFTGSIDKASQSAPTAYGSTVTYGSTATASASGGGGVGSIEWSNGSSRSATGSQNTQARWTGNDNYYASGWSNTVTLTVNKANPSYTAPTAKTGLTYNGGSQTLYNAGSNTTAGSFSYSNGTRTSAGSQTVSWSFTPTDTTNYNSASGSFTGTIAQATGSVSFTTKPTSVSMGSTAATAISKTGDGSISYSSSNTDVATIDSSGVITGVGGGTATITVTLSAGTNYTGASDSYTITSVLNGVGILYTDGTISNYNTRPSGKSLVGVAVKNSNVSLVIYQPDIDYEYYSNPFGSWQTRASLVPNIVTTTDVATAKLDYAGKANTATIKAYNNPGTIFSDSFLNIFIDGRSGYIPACGELNELVLNEDAILTALRQTYRYQPSRFSSWVWSSTQERVARVWGWYGYNNEFRGSFAKTDSTYGAMVVATL